MADPKQFYQCLLDHCRSDLMIDRVLIGLVWTLCQSRKAGKETAGTGLAMSPSVATRVLPWSGTLAGQALKDIAAGILDWEPYRATVAMAAINSSLNQTLPVNSIAIANLGEQPNLAVFDYFLPQLQGKKVVVIGHYPGIERYHEQMQLQVLERQPQTGDYPDPAAEFLLPQADWVFLTASSIPNKTFPRLAELATDAKTVLMGPTTPWLPQLHEFGIDYLAGVEVLDIDVLYQTAAEGGGVRIFNSGLRYRIAELTPSYSMSWLKQTIADVYAEKARLTDAMEAWYAAGNSRRFPDYQLLAQLTSQLSRLDSSFKTLWDANPDSRSE